MQLNLVGVNHRTAPIAIREKAAISSEGLAEALKRLQSYVPHAVILSTCNRTEVYAASDGDEEDVENGTLDFLQARLGVPREELTKYIYTFDDKEAAGHLFRVTSGLESMIVGEFEVLGQAGQALETAETTGLVNLPLRHLFNSAIRAGRRVRDETGISKNALSVSSVAVDLATNIVGKLDKSKMLVIGAGEAGRLVAKVARERGAAQIVIASRTKQRAQAVATALRGVATDLSNLANEMQTANIVVTCAGAPHHLLDYRKVSEVMQRRSELPLVVIDIAVPRNVNPEVGRVPNVFLYNIDDLTGIAARNRKQREKEIRRVEEIVDGEVGKFIDWWHDLKIRPVVGALMSRAEEIRQAQLGQTLKKLPPLSDEQLESLEAMTKSIVTRILRCPVRYLKNNGNGQHADLVMELFDLRAGERR